MEKNFSLLPEPYNIEVVACDEEIPDPLENMSKTAGPAVALGEGTIIINFHFLTKKNNKHFDYIFVSDEVWPMPKEAFQLNVVL